MYAAYMNGHVQTFIPARGEGKENQNTNRQRVECFGETAFHSICLCRDTCVIHEVIMYGGEITNQEIWQLLSWP